MFKYVQICLNMFKPLDFLSHLKAKKKHLNAVKTDQL